MRHIFYQVLLFTCFFYGTFFAKAQERNLYEYGVLPSLTLGKKINDRWKVNLSVESRQSFGQPSEFEYNYVLSDFTGVVSRKVGLNNQLGAGYVLRFREGERVHRFLQQLTWARKFTAFRLGQRFRADQTFAHRSTTTFRLRYRLAVEIPLNGEALNRHEIYLKLSQELLGSQEGQTRDVEWRLVPLLGYFFTDKNKLEIGPDYRWDRILSRDVNRHRLWWAIKWYVSF